MKWTSLVKLGLSLIGAASGGFVIGKLSMQKSLNKERAALKKTINISKEKDAENSFIKEQNAHFLIEIKKNKIEKILASLTDKELKEALRSVGNLFLSLLENKFINKIDLNEKELDFIAVFDKMISSENVKKSELEFAIEFAKQKLY